MVDYVAESYRKFLVSELSALIFYITAGSKINNDSSTSVDVFYLHIL